MQYGGDVAVFEFESVVSVNGVRLIGKAKPVQRSVKPVATSIAGKDSAGSSSAVGCRCQSHYQQPCVASSEAWNGFAPVVEILKSGNLGSSGLLCPCHEARTARAFADRAMQSFDCGGWRVDHKLESNESPKTRKALRLMASGLKVGQSRGSN